MNTFSDRESQILKIIGRKKLTLNEISDKLWKGEKKPFDANISVANSVRRIMHKCKYHNIPWTLEKTKVNRRMVIKKINNKGE